ncbi:Peptide chain release factor 1 [Bienertia sinuspersici]
MDLNEVPRQTSDIMVNGLKIEENNVVTFDGVVDKGLGHSRIKCNEVEQICREVEEKSLVLELEIRNKEMNLETIKANIRVLGDEKMTIEKEIRDLKRNKKVVLDGAESSDSMNDYEVESDEVARVDQLMVENKVLECEKNVALKEVEVWKQKCKDLESRVLELERRLKCKEKDSILIGIKAVGAAAINCDDVCALGDFGSPSDAIDGVIPVEGTPDNHRTASEITPTNGMRVKRRLAYRNVQICDEKIAPPTPAGGKASAASVIDIIDSDNECDVDARLKPNLQSEGNTYMMSEHVSHETDEIMNDVHCGEEQSGGKGDPTYAFTPITKRKRDLMVVTTDDECDDHECTPNRRALKIENSDNEGEEDDDKSRIIKQVSKKITSESESDDDDNIPISQLKRRRAHQSASTLTRPRRRLVKYGQAEQGDKLPEMANHSNTLIIENAANDYSSEEESESSVKSLSDFIVDDSNDENVEDDGGDHYSGLEEESDNNLGFEEIISRLQSRRHPNSEWTSEGDMLSDFGKNPEMCLRAVCALYRQQTIEEKACKASIIPNGRGFSKFDATRGTCLGEFLTDGDPNGDLVKSVEELQVHDRHGLKDCRRLADHYSKQLFNIYENGEDRFFP